jgi:hypothetical protein
MEVLHAPECCVLRIADGTRGLQVSADNIPAETPVTFREASYALFSVEENAVMTTVHGNLAIFSTKGMADIWASHSAKKVEVRTVYISPGEQHGH